MLWRIALFIPILSLLGCGTNIKGSNPVIAKKQQPHATVYFIRAKTERAMGYADNRLTVFADGSPLLKIRKGEYTIVKFHPGQVWISTSTATSWGPHHRIKNKTDQKSFTFTSGYTYFISFEAVDGEFRGVHYTSKAIDYPTARTLATTTKAVGFARWNPIQSLDK